MFLRTSRPIGPIKKQEELHVVRTLVCDIVQSLCDSTHTKVRTTYRKYILSGLRTIPASGGEIFTNENECCCRLVKMLPNYYLPVVLPPKTGSRCRSAMFRVTLGAMAVSNSSNAWMYRIPISAAIL